MLHRLVCLTAVCCAFIASEINLHKNNFPYSVLLCSAAKAKQNAKAHSILFIGSSRVGAGIDLEQLDTYLAEGGHPEENLARLVAFRSDKVQQNLLVRTYLRHHGAPSHVILEATFRKERSISEDQSVELIPRVPVSSYRSISVQDYADLLSDPDVSKYIENGKGYLRANHINTIEFLSNRFAQGFYHFLDNPLGVFRLVDKECSPENIERLWWGKAENYGNVLPPARHQTPFLETASEAELRYDLTFLRNTIEVLKEAGVPRVTLFGMPDAAQREPSNVSAALLAEYFPKTPYVELLRISTQAERDFLAGQYRDHAHLSPAGAELTSKILARYLVQQVD